MNGSRRFVSVILLFLSFGCTPNANRENRLVSEISLDSLLDTSRSEGDYLSYIKSHSLRDSSWSLREHRHLVASPVFIRGIPGVLSIGWNVGQFNLKAFNWLPEQRHPLSNFWDEEDFSSTFFPHVGDTISQRNWPREERGEWSQKQLEDTLIHRIKYYQPPLSKRTLDEVLQFGKLMAFDSIIQIGHMGGVPR